MKKKNFFWAYYLIDVLIILNAYFLLPPSKGIYLIIIGPLIIYAIYIC